MQISNTSYQAPIKTHDDAKAHVKENLKNIGIDLGDRDLSSVSGKDITNAYFANSLQISFKSLNVQTSLASFSYEEISINSFNSALSKLGEGFDNLSNLTPKKAKELISEDGYWGAKQTGERIAGFVLSGAGDNVESLKIGREGIMRGFNQAKNTLGGFKNGYGDLANETIENALKIIDEKIAKLGGNVLDIKA